MPRTRSEVGRDVKVNQILDTAEAIARERGLRAVSVAEVARVLGLSANSIYWYFPSRDELWIGVVERMAAKAFEAKAGSDMAWDRQVLWLVDHLADVYPLVVVLQDHAGQSERLAEFQRELQSRVQGLLEMAIRAHVPSSADPERDALAILTVVVGCYALEVTSEDRQALVESAIAQLQS